MYEELVKRLRETTVNHNDKCESCPYEEEYPCCVDCLDEMHIEAADAIEELSKPKWIPVTERLPEMNTSCLLYNKYYGPMVGTRIDDMRFRIPGSHFPDTPTHWMPLPEPPKEG